MFSPGECVTQVEAWGVDDLAEGHPQPDLGGPLLTTKEDAGQGIKHAVAISCGGEIVDSLF